MMCLVTQRNSAGPLGPKHLPPFGCFEYVGLPFRGSREKKDYGTSGLLLGPLVCSNPDLVLLVS